MNLMALHIVEKGEHPIFFYGQSYLGPVEAYVGALMFHLFGVSVLSMRLGALLMYSGFLICMYFITSRVYTRSLALITVGLLGLASPWVFSYQLVTTGYTSLSFLCALLFLLSYLLVCSQGDWYRRAILYLLWGVVAGVAIWAQLTVAPYVLVSGLLLVIEWRSLMKYGLWFLLVGLVLGAFPLIYYNLHAARGTDSLSIFLKMSSLGATNHYPLKSYIISPFVITLPATLGLGSSCYIGHLPIVPLVYPHTATCLIAQAVYGFGYVVLLIIAGIMACVALFITRRHQMRQEYVQHWARLMLLLGAGLTLLVFAHSSTSVYTGVLGVRYLICMLVSLPAVLWAVWKGLDYIRKLLPQIGEWLSVVVRLGVVMMLCLISIDATVHTFEQIPAAQANQQQFVQLAEGLESLHITRFFSEYWTCNRLIFQTQEQLVCADTWPNLTHGFDRYRAYRAMVEADPNPGFVYARGSGRIHELETALQATHTPYQRFEIAGFVIYRPAHRVPGIKLYQN
jgi:4-amino-4-deoxy-L-arabinose transferase-like glycosyltransferase